MTEPSLLYVQTVWRSTESSGYRCASAAFPKILTKQYIFHCYTFSLLKDICALLKVMKCECYNTIRKIETKAVPVYFGNSLLFELGVAWLE